MSGYSDQFASDLNRLLGVPDTAASHTYYQAWAQAEGGAAAYNPFNTTQAAPGSTHYNSFGAGGNSHVENYASYQSGLAATAQTLKNGLYQPILSALGSGSATPMQLAQAEAQTPWGTGTLIQKVLGGGTNASPPTAGGSVITAGWSPFSNPLDWPKDLFGATAGAAGSAAASAFGSIIRVMVAPFEKYLEDAVLVVFGLVLIVVGLIMLAKAAGSGSAAPAAAASSSGGGKKDEGDGEAAGGGADVADAAVLA